MMMCPRCETDDDRIEEHRTYWFCNNCAHKWNKPMKLKALIVVGLLFIPTIATAQKMDPSITFNEPLVGGSLEDLDWVVTHTAEPPKQPSKWPFRVALMGYGTMAFWDASNTAYCHGLNTCNEANPILRNISNDYGIVTAMTVKGALHTGIGIGLSVLHEKYPNKTFWTTIGLTAAQAVVNGLNYRRLKDAQ